MKLCTFRLLMPTSLKKQSATTLCQMWKQPERLRAQACIAFHNRQFGAWWKFELATRLWGFAAPFGSDVFIDRLGRADVVLPSANETSGIPKSDMCRPLCPPIKLKPLALGGAIPGLPTPIKGTARRRIPWTATETYCRRNQLDKLLRPTSVLDY